MFIMSTIILICFDDDHDQKSNFRSTPHLWCLSARKINKPWTLAIALAIALADLEFHWVPFPFVAKLITG